jgi:hypothetical protein
MIRHVCLDVKDMLVGNLGCRIRISSGIWFD